MGRRSGQILDGTYFSYKSWDPIVLAALASEGKERGGKSEYRGMETAV